MTGVKINFEQAREIVQNRHGGVPLRIWLKELNGKKCYYVRILFPEGKVHTYAVDAQTGDEIARQPFDINGKTYESTHR